MPADLRDVWRDEDGPPPAELAAWSDGRLSQLALDNDGRRIVRLALKDAWCGASEPERSTIDRLLEQLKEER